MSEYSILKTLTIQIMIALVSILFVALCIVSSVLYAKMEINKAWWRNRNEFIEMYPVVQFEIRGMPFCYDPRNREVKEAVYKGKGVFQVKGR